ncbi:MAG: hypothetical protein NWF01_06460 [Candidatus Bathyarchaeota archaeon]|nr:hypothetical protein [Candidatus Bathyarchaeota archaeon]
MLNLQKSLAVALIVVLTASSLILIKPSEAAIPKPSVPEFTLEFADHSYDVAPTTTTTIDPFTGQEVTITTQNGYHVDGNGIDVIIRNQPVSSYEDSQELKLYYNVRFKGHFAEDIWTNWKTPLETGSIKYKNSPILASDSDETIITVTFSTLATITSPLPAGAQIDFKVEAFIGYREVRGTAVVYIGENSGYSSIQTITVGDPASITPTPTPTALSTPTFSSLNSETPNNQDNNQTLSFGGLDSVQIAVIVLGVIVAVVVLGVFLRKTHHK